MNAKTDQNAETKAAGAGGTVATGQGGDAKDAATSVQNPVAAEGNKEAVDAAKGKAPKEGLAQALSVPDTEGRKGEVVKKGQMVRPVHGRMVDNLTGEVYAEATFTEVEKPSAWLDGQLRAKKVEVR